MENPIGEYKVKKTVYDKDFKRTNQIVSYPIYRNDLKFRKSRNLDMNNIYSDHKIEDMDSLEYRIKECVQHGGHNLDLSNLELKTFPSGVPKNIKRLFIADNELESLPDLSSFFNLEILDCSKNKLHNIPKLPLSIEEIFCENNKITNIDFIAQFPNLKRIDFSHNRIKNVPATHHIEIAYLSYNQISQINDQTKLRRLTINNNLLKTITNCPHLEELECNHNDLKEIRGLRSLKLLSSEHNNILEIKDLDNIRSIQCIGNPLKVLPYFPKLEEITCNTAHIQLISKKYKVEDYIETKQKYLIMRFSTH